MAFYVIWVLQTAQLPLDGQQRKVTSPLQRSDGFEFLWRSSKVKERKKKRGGVCVLLSDTAEDESLYVCVCRARLFPLVVPAEKEKKRVMTRSAPYFQQPPSCTTIT